MRIAAMGADAKVWLIGEHNPYGVDPEFALYPAPRNSAGDRLRRRILGMTLGDYFRSFRRVNLVQDEEKEPKWSKVAARRAAEALVTRAAFPVGEIRRTSEPPLLVLLGKRVTEAFGLKYDPFFGADTCYGQLGGSLFTLPTLILPHPSGRSLDWNDPTAIPKAREALARLAPHLASLLGKVDATRDATS